MREAYYADLRPRLKTGDIVLIAGQGQVSATIALLTGSEWTHVGQLLVVGEWDLVLLWESANIRSIVDVCTERETRGVQTVPLSDRVRGCAGRVAVRQLNRPLTAEMETALRKYRREVQSAAYDQRSRELLKSTWDPSVDHVASAFGAELVADCWRRIGLLGTGEARVTPRDFAAGGQLPLLKGFALGEEVLVQPARAAAA